jgi:hypothetical protein
MKIYKVIADSRPECCFLCPLRGSTIKLTLDCGKVGQRDIGGGWTSSSRYPDDRCLFEGVAEA